MDVVNTTYGLRSTFSFISLFRLLIKIILRKLVTSLPQLLSFIVPTNRSVVFCLHGRLSGSCWGIVRSNVTKSLFLVENRWSVSALAEMSDFGVTISVTDATGADSLM